MLFCNNCNSFIFFCTCSSEDDTVNQDNNDNSLFGGLFGSNDSDDSDNSDYWSNISSNDE